MQTLQQSIKKIAVTVPLEKNEETKAYGGCDLQSDSLAPKTKYRITLWPPKELIRTSYL
jgi:hypothetical protein